MSLPILSTSLTHMLMSFNSLYRSCRKLVYILRLSSPMKIKSETPSSAKDNDQTNVYLKMFFLTEEIPTVIIYINPK